MAVTFATLTVDPDSLVGATPSGPVIVTVRTNTGGAILDAAADKIFLGTASQSVTTGAATFSLPVTNGASNPTDFQYTVDIRYRYTESDGTSERATWNSGWFSFTASANLADIAAEQYVPPTWISTAIGTLQGYLDDAAELLAQQEEISGLTGEDDAVALLVNTPGSDTEVALSTTFVATVSPLAYGAVGNDTADDTAALQSTVNAAALAVFGTVDLRGRTYKLTDDFDVPANVRVMNGTLRQSVAGKRIATVTGSNVTFTDVDFQGLQSATYTLAERLVWAAGTVGTPIDNLTVKGCTFSDAGGMGIWGEHLTNVTIDDNTFDTIQYAGAMFSSCLVGRFTNNRVRNIIGTAAPGTNAYGVSLTRDELDSLITAPKSADWYVAGNDFEDIPTWAGVDMHGGERVVVEGNTFRHVKIPVAVGETDNASNVATWASHDVIVANNDMTSEVTNGSWGYAINVTGCFGTAVGTPGELSTGVKVIGNTIRGYGLETSSIGAAVFLRDTKGAVVAQNTIIEPGYSGVLFYYDNYGYTCIGNTIIDPWSNTAGNTAVYGVAASRAGYNTGVVVGNHTVRGSKSATYVATHCVVTDSATGTSISVGSNMGGSVATIGAAAGSLATLDLSSTPFTTSGLASLGTALIGTTGVQGALTVKSTGATVSGYQAALRAAPGGYGAGLRFESIETGTSTVLPQAKITADGEASWANAAGASSYLSLWTASAGTLTEHWRVRASGNLEAQGNKSILLAAGTGIVKTGRGITSARPAAATAGAGAMWYDTTLSKPIWSDGGLWRDAAGTAV